MFFKKSKIFVLTFMLLVLGISNAEGQVALNASPDDPVYQAIDLFIAHDLVRDVIVGQRPYSRLEIARIIRRARESLNSRSDLNKDLNWKKYAKELSKKEYIEKLIAYYEKEYSVELEGMKDGVHFELLKQAELAAFYNGSKPRRIPRSNGQGFIDGFITSFDRYDQGLTYPDGGGAYIQTEHNLYLTPYLLFSAEPRFEFLGSNDGDSQVMAHIHKLYMKTGWRNFEFQIGRDNLLWGQGEQGGLFGSSNPRPLDMIKISNPYPFRFPWVFKYLGHNKFTFFVSNLGPDRNFKYPYFYGLKWSLRPARYFEFALSHTVMMGGEGAPGVKWWEPMAELLPFHKWGGANIGQDDIANNAFGFFEFRVTIPQFRGTSIYYEAYIEDSIVRAFRLSDNLLNQLAFTVGWYTPRLTSNGDYGIRLEYHHIPPLAYRHSKWSSGYTLNQRLIGDPLGPTADGVYATLYWRPRPNILANVQVAYEDYDSSTYFTQTNASGGGDKILKDVAKPHERRLRMLADLNYPGKKRCGIRLSAGYEYINNWDFVVGRSVNNLFLRTILTLRFDEFNFSTN